MTPETIAALAGAAVLVIGALAGATVRIIREIRRQGRELGAKADVAATKASEAQKTAVGIHKKTAEIVAQTDGQLSVLREENQRLHEMVASLVAIMSAREGKAVPVRGEDPAAVLKQTNGPLLRRSGDKPDGEP